MISFYKNKKVTVVGLARSGVAAARLLRRFGANVAVTDKSKNPAQEALAVSLVAEGITVELGQHSLSFIDGCDFIVISPGVPLNAQPVIWAYSFGIPVISEIELAASVCPARIIAITGTNGKTTTTTLVGEVLRAAGRRVHVLGNIGKPFCSGVLDVAPRDYVSLEVSSFQLETIRDSFCPYVAVILNLTPDHLDRYKDVDEYLDAKKRIFENQGAGDFLVLNYGDPALRSLGEALAAEPQAKRPKVIFFNRTKDGASGGLDQNQMAVVTVAEALGIGLPTCRAVFKNFKGVEHRLEFVRVKDGVEFVNDSKATNIDSTVWALSNIKKPAVLIAGGRDKDSDFSSIAGLVRQKVKHVILCGEASDKIARAWEGVVPLERTATYEEAVRTAFDCAAAGDIVLLSPMCKSFDLFADYEHRGRVFKDLVNKL